MRTNTSKNVVLQSMMVIMLKVSDYTLYAQYMNSTKVQSLLAQLLIIINGLANNYY